jgi:citrate synthase
MEREKIIITQVREMLAEALSISIDKIPSELMLGGIEEWDSMGHMSIMMLMEEKFGVEIDAETIGNLTSISAICDFLEKKN